MFIGNQEGEDRFKERNSQILSQTVKNRESLLKRGIVVINTDFNDYMMEDVFFKIKQLEEDRNVDQITIYINSVGGQVYSCMPLVDAIDSCKKPVNTVVMGYAYSAGAILLACGHKGNRKAHKHSSILIHEVSSATVGKVTQMELDIESTKSVNKMLINLLKDRTKLTKEDIKKYLESTRDHFLTPEQALSMGLIDQII